MDCCRNGRKARRDKILGELRDADPADTAPTRVVKSEKAATRPLLRYANAKPTKIAILCHDHCRQFGIIVIVMRTHVICTEPGCDDDDDDDDGQTQEEKEIEVARDKEGERKSTPHHDEEKQMS